MKKTSIILWFQQSILGLTVRFFSACLISFLCMIIIGGSTGALAGGLILAGPEGTDWQPIWEGGRIRPPRPTPMPDFRPFPLEVVSEKAAVSIEGQVVKTEIDQVFYNTSSSRLEGWFMLPIPKGAVIANFSMFVNGKELTAELLDADKAKQIYENIVRQFRDPALLEYQEQDLFKVRIFPIEPNSEKRVKISYQQLLNPEDGTLEYIYPLNTQKYSARPLKEVSINIELHDEAGIKNIYSPTHEISLTSQNNKTTLASFKANNIKPDTDFRLYYTIDKSALGMSLLSYKPAGEDGYFFLSISPGFGENPSFKPIEKDITFVIDVSGSMTDGKLDKAKEALRFCIQNLNKGDCFNIIRFSTEARPLFNDPQSANKENIGQAMTFIDNLKPIGGTNIDDALTQALQMQRKGNRPYFIAFITDGKPTVGTTDEEQLLGKLKTVNKDNVRVFTVGIGDDLNTHLLDKLTEQTRSFRTYITPKEDIEVKLSNFYTKIATPALTDLQLSFGHGADIYDVYPKELPDLFKGSAITVIGRYRAMGGSENTSVSLKGKVNEQEQTYNFTGHLTANTQSERDFIPSLWASRKVGYLLDQIRLHGENKELVDEVKSLAKKYGIVTPYTSYLILEDDETTLQPPPPPRPVPTPVPMPRSPRPGVNSPKMPSTAKSRSAPSADYNAMKERSGRESVRSSTEIQALNKAENLDQTKQGQSRIDVRDKDGRSADISQQYRQIQGRAFYLSENNLWIDAYVYKQPKGSKPKRIQFASDAYFALLKANPDLKDILALSENIQFVWKGSFYEIYE